MEQQLAQPQPPQAIFIGQPTTNAPKNHSRIIITAIISFLILATAATLIFFILANPKHYTNKTFGFSLPIPDGFEVQDEISSDKMVVTMYPETQKDNIKNLYLVYAYEAPGENIAEYSSAQILSELKNMGTTSIDSTSIKKVQYKGLSCAELSIEQTATEPGMYTIWCNKNDNGYQITTMGYPKSEFDKLLDSFELK